MEIKQYKILTQLKYPIAICNKYNVHDLAKESEYMYSNTIDFYTNKLIMNLFFYINTTKTYRSFINKFGKHLFLRDNLYKKNVELLIQKIDEDGYIVEESCIDLDNWNMLKRKSQLNGGIIK